MTISNPHIQSYCHSNLDRKFESIKNYGVVNFKSYHAGLSTKLLKIIITNVDVLKDNNKRQKVLEASDVLGVYIANNI